MQCDLVADCEELPRDRICSQLSILTLVSQTPFTRLSRSQRHIISPSAAPWRLSLLGSSHGMMNLGGSNGPSMRLEGSRYLGQRMYLASRQSGTHEGSSGSCCSCLASDKICKWPSSSIKSFAILVYT